MGIDLRGVKNFDLFMPKYYQMDPRVEDYLFDGTELREGMVVLVDSVNLRVDVYDILDSDEVERAYRYNRYFKVSRLTVSDDDDMITCLAEYGDGSKKKLCVRKDTPWLVLREDPNVREVSVPVEEDDINLVDPDAKQDFEGLPSVGRAQVKPSWSTPPFGGGDDDLETAPLPRRSVGNYSVVETNSGAMFEQGSLKSMMEDPPGSLFEKMRRERNLELSAFDKDQLAEQDNEND